jgi:3-phenylpropionate/cinnamic acid dioxygenase small subunit
MNTPKPRSGSGDGLYAEVQQFYARQMQLLDSGDGLAWGQTFTADGVFEASGAPGPVQGREAISTAAQDVVDQFAAAAISRRHLISMLTVDPLEDGTVRARSYALVLEIPDGREAAVQSFSTCDDVLASEDGRWLVRARRVTREDAGAPLADRLTAAR